MPSTTNDRVPFHTDDAVNRTIKRETRARVRYYVANPQKIDRRLRELDREWDIERMLETNASLVALTGVVLGVTVDRRWLALPALVTAFLFQHAVQGWCPPLPLLRRAGLRTSREIEIERVALKVLRGDFRGDFDDDLPDAPSRDTGGRTWRLADQALEAAERS